ncbi:MAG: hypothetical protein AAFX90_06135 [Pseudomonadota bacterium]
MKSLITAVTLSASVLAAPAMAMGISSLNLTRDLTFPTPITEPVTQDQIKPGK